MWWGKSQDTTDPKASSPSTKDTAVATAASAASAAGVPADPQRYGSSTPKKSTDAPAPFDPEKLPNRTKLPPGLQSIVDKQDKDDNFFDELREGYVPESTESNVRFAAYAARARTILLAAHRYVAYTSDIGESFRPIAHPYLVRGAYGVSWAYILGDVSYEGYKAYWHNQRILNPRLELSDKQKKIVGLSDAVSGTTSSTTSDLAPRAVPPLEDWRTVMAQRAIFQSVASMGLPAFTIHTVVRYSGRALKDAKNKTIRTWGPIGLGLAVVPFLPTLFDEPVETATEWIFHKGFETFGGKEYVGEAPTTGREKALVNKKPKEKEL